MRPRHAACCADLPDDLTGRHLIANMHINDGQVGQQRKNPEAVIDDEGVAGEVQVARHHHSAAVRGVNRCARGAEEIGPAMWLARLTVEDASRAEATGRTPGDRAHERVAPSSILRGLCPYAREVSSLAHDALQYRRRRIHNSIVDAKGV